MKDFEIWKSYIDALEILVNQHSESFDIEILDVKDDLFINGRYIDTIRDKIFFKLLEIFPELKKEYVNYEDNFLLYPSTSSIVKSNLKDFQTFSEINYLDLSFKPSFSGVLKYQKSLLKDFFEKVDIKNVTDKNSNIQFLTLEELNNIDFYLDKSDNIFREEKIGAISKIGISESFITKQSLIVKKYLRETIGVSSFEEQGFFKEIQIENIFLKKEAIDIIESDSFYSSSFHSVSYEIDHLEFDKFEEIRKSKNIYYKSEDKSDLQGVILPNPSENTFIQTFQGSISFSDLKFEILFFLNTLKRYFSRESIKITHKQILQIEKDRFFKYLRNLIPYKEFQISSDSKTIAFDFQTKSELKNKLKALEKYKSINILGFRDDHRYKITFVTKTPLQEINAELNKLNFTKTIINNSGNELKVFGLMTDIGQLSIIKARVENIINKYKSKDIVLEWDTIDNGFLKYFFRFNQEGYEEEIINKLNSLKGESFSTINSKEIIGTLKSVSYPEITLSLEDQINLLSESRFLTIKSNLKGEKDKIKRLQEAINQIYSNNGENLKKALIDSSCLEPFIKGDIKQTQEYKNIYQKINEDLLSPYINERQKEAITKCLLSKDLFVIQGPPGTGKSTAIAELIWQHIINQESRNYKILVTSETNLAVDNALDKLRSDLHILIRPIRFGAKEKLDEEGRKYSLEALDYWKNGEWESEESLIVDDWLRIIGKRCKNPNNSFFLNQWKEHLEEKTQTLRDLVYNSYIKHCNVIGATCSSIGKINSEGRFTRFFQEYCNIFHVEDYNNFKKHPNKNYANNLKNKIIDFDLVIQDEASKASPPELALPFTYGKKAVIIGDHRQLPPLIDTNEFIESLNYLKDKSKDRAEKNKINKLISFIKKYRDNFEISHFEKIFKNIHPNLKSTFDTQYRMHPAINETIKQFYRGDFEDGKDLECGLAIELVDSPNLNESMSRYHGITRNKDTHIMWFDIRTPEIKKGTSRINIGEVEAIKWIVNTITSNENYANFIKHWKESEKEQKELGIITFYGAQAGLIKKNLPKNLDVRVSPVDRFQGMERNIIIVSLVRSNIIAENEIQVEDYETYPEYGFAENESLGFAELPNRLNVALSRAKRLLIVVGNSKHFSKKEIYKSVYETIKNHPQGEVWKFNDEKPIRVL